MAERAQRTLPYGHFGRAAYSLDDSEWHFERSFAAPLSIKPLGDPKQVCPPDAQFQPEQIRKEPPALRQRRQIKHLVARIPELQPAARLLPELLRVSEATQTALSNHDATRAGLITTTNIRSELHHRWIQIAALPAGSTRSDLRLVRVQKQRRGWAEREMCWINVPTLYGEEVVWKGMEGPIQQVLFAQPLDRCEALLGVRFLTKTMIFRPRHGFSTENVDAASALQPNLLYNIDMSSTGGSVHVDIAFNPWFSQQIAIVDQDGSLTVMEFQSRKLARIARSWKAKVKSTALSDGWARVAWMFNLEIVAVCNRESLVLFRIAGKTLTILHTVTPEIEHGAQWILDFASIPGHPDCCVLLTSTQLLVYQVSGVDMRQIEVHTKCTIDHFKNPEDIGMRLHVWSSQEDMFVLLYAGRGNTKIVYRFGFAHETQYRVHEPLELQLLTNDRAARITEIKFLSAPSTDNRPQSHSESAFQGQYFVATVMYSDGSIFEQLLSCTSTHPHAELSVPSWESKLVVSGVISKQSSFIDDTDIGADVATKAPASRRARSTAPRRQPEERTLELGRVAGQLSALAPSLQPIEHALEGVKSAFDVEESTIMPLRTLDSLIPDKVDTSNIDALAAALDGAEGLLSLPRGSPEGQDGVINTLRRLQIVRTATPPVLHLDSEFRDGSLTSVYGTIVAGWLGPLSDQVSARIRLAKVALARQVATDLTLSNLVVRVDERESPTDAPVNRSDARPTWELPVRSSAYDEPEAASSTIHSPQYSALPTPSATATPSVASMSTGMSSLAAPEIYRLSRYVPITKPSPMILARPMRKILSHWVEGESPDDYDWRRTSKHINREEEDEEKEHMTEKELRRLRRHAERHIKRQRKEAEASQAQQLASSQAPEVLAASQPNFFAVENQPTPASLQSSVPHANAVSQVVPGRFGGRPPPKKKRKSGF